MIDCVPDLPFLETMAYMFKMIFSGLLVAGSITACVLLIIYLYARFSK